VSTPIVMPKQGQSVESCIIAQWMKKKGDQVAKGDVLLNFETDKASFDLEAPESGILLETFYNVNDDVPVLAVVGVIGEPGENTDIYKPENKQQSTAPQASQQSQTAISVTPVLSAQTPIATNDNTIHTASPRAKNAAKKRGVLLDKIQGTGPHGRILERDILSAPLLSRTAVERKNAENLFAPDAGSGIGGMIRSADLVAHNTSPSALQNIPDGYEEIKVSNIRKLIGSRMLASLQESAQLTMHSCADATALLDMRNKAKNNETGITITDMVVMAVARTLTAFGDLNCLYKNDKIYKYKNVHIALAVDTPRGLMVPVIQNCNMLAIDKVSQTIKDLANQCRDGSINPDFLSGGTFTITNLGMFGIENFTPVINLPQVAILGINAITPKPFKTINNTYEIRSGIGFSLTIDHRIVDGAPGARFLQALCESITHIDENWERWQQI